MKSDSVLDLPYQLIHRAASACGSTRDTKALVYLIFGPEPEEHYVEDLRALDGILGYPEALSMHVLHVPFTASDRFALLTRRWDNGKRHLGEEVREALLEGGLFGFETPRVLYARGKSA